MQTIFLTRAPNDPSKTTMGAFIFGDTVCDSLEPAFTNPVHEGHPAIPAGTYRVQMLFSEHFQRDLPHVMDVPNRAEIMIHPGNTAEDSLGCILVGTKNSDSSIENSHPMSDKLNEWLIAQDGVEITIV